MLYFWQANGEPDFIGEQLESIYQQDHSNIEIWISIDCDNPNLLQFLKKYEGKKCNILEGPKKGFVENFLYMICHLKIQADYFAFSDQDDIWKKNKLSHSLTILQSLCTEKPILYASRTHLVSSTNEDLGFSPIFSKKPSFKNALVQSIGGGNTMLMNRKARELLQKRVF